MSRGFAPSSACSSSRLLGVEHPAVNDFGASVLIPVPLAEDFLPGADRVVHAPAREDAADAHLFGPGLQYEVEDLGRARRGRVTK